MCMCACVQQHESVCEHTKGSASVHMYARVVPKWLWQQTVMPTMLFLPLRWLGNEHRHQGEYFENREKMGHRGLCDLIRFYPQLLNELKRNILHILLLFMLFILPLTNESWNVLKPVLMKGEQVVNNGPQITPLSCLLSLSFIPVRAQWEPELLNPSSSVPPGTGLIWRGQIECRCCNSVHGNYVYVKSKEKRRYMQSPM